MNGPFVSKELLEAFKREPYIIDGFLLAGELDRWAAESIIKDIEDRKGD